MELSFPGHHRRLNNTFAPFDQASSCDIIYLSIYLGNVWKLQYDSILGF